MDEDEQAMLLGEHQGQVQRCGEPNPASRRWFGPPSGSAPTLPIALTPRAGLTLSPGKAQLSRGASGLPTEVTAASVNGYPGQGSPSPAIDLLHHPRSAQCRAGRRTEGGQEGRAAPRNHRSGLCPPPTSPSYICSFQGTEATAPRPRRRPPCAALPRLVRQLSPRPRSRL